jgi:hypothetical protein
MSANTSDDVLLQVDSRLAYRGHFRPEKHHFSHQNTLADSYRWFRKKFAVFEGVEPQTLSQTNVSTNRTAPPHQNPYTFLKTAVKNAW